MIDDHGHEGEERPRDRKIDEVKVELMGTFFPAGRKEVFYGRQLEVALEDKFFHWITKKGLNELQEERQIRFEAHPAGPYRAHFYWPLAHRYPRREIREIARLVGEFSDPIFTESLGDHGEKLAEIGLGRAGFRTVAKNVRSFQERVCLAARVRERLGLPVAAVKELPDTAVKRFTDWHLKLVNSELNSHKE